MEKIKIKENDSDLVLLSLKDLLEKKKFFIMKEVKNLNNLSGVINLPKRFIGKIAVVIIQDENKGTDSSG